jgi:tryptophan halogenase
MKICIIGQGAAGWMAATYFSRALNNLEKMYVIGSPEIKTIGVGESNTLALSNFHSELGISKKDFIKYSDAAVKYGVLYKNWAHEDFLHNFKRFTPWEDKSVYYFKSLTNKPDNISINDLIAPDLNKFTKENKISRNEDFYPKSWHFDAGMYISFLEKINLPNEKIESIKDTVIDCEFCADKKLQSVVLQSGRIIEADYYIFASGTSKFLTDILGEKYESLSDVLLTDKAWVYPLNYTNKRQQFHPYTVAKTMECGWRWITPTYSRIGTGYVYSSKHISDDEALDEFLEDIGDKNISPKLVEFKPRYNKQTFKINYCTLGMANGFLEPLDAPGLSLTIEIIWFLHDILDKMQNYDSLSTEVNFLRDYSNYTIESFYKRWASFILCQYKTSSSRENKFWRDHRNIEWNYYSELIEGFQYFYYDSINVGENVNDFMIMFYHTMAAKNYHWKTEIKTVPFTQPTQKEDLIHHLDYIEYIRNLSKINLKFHSTANKIFKL